MAGLLREGRGPGAGPDLKVCKTCCVPKARVEYVKASRTKDRLRGSCKACHRENMRSRYMNVPGVKERVRQTVKTWRSNNRERRSETERNRRLKSEMSFRKDLLRRLRTNASSRGIPFDLELEDLTIPEHCPVLGIRLEINRERGCRPDSSPSVDRIIPVLGYVKGNVQMISSRANRLKQDATVPELEAIVRYIRERT